MTGLGIDMNGLRGLALNFTRQVSGLGACTQNALVLLLKPRGADLTRPTDGTDLMRQGSYGLMISRTQAQHTFNFASADVLAQVNDGAENAEDQLERLHLQISEFNPPVVRLNVYASGNDGQVQGVDLFL